jgi:hypothetical protein
MKRVRYIKLGARRFVMRIRRGSEIMASYSSTTVIRALSTILLQSEGVLYYRFRIMICIIKSVQNVIKFFPAIF